MAKRNYGEDSLKAHAGWRGKFEIKTRVSLATGEDLSLAYTPGVAAPCLEIARDPRKSYDYTRRWNLCLVVTDGTAVLGLGDIGPEAALPVMEGKCVLFKELGAVDALPLCIKSKDVDEIVRTIYLLSGSFGGINLEDISAPRCFEIERRLKALCDIPVFHDDQHGTAVVVQAALLNALRLTGKTLEEVRIVISGAGAAGLATSRLLLASGAGRIILCDREGTLYPGRQEGMNPDKEAVAALTNQEGVKGDLAQALEGAEVLIGLSGPGLVSRAMVERMAPGPLVFACANPDPEIDPRVAREAGAALVATGRSDYPNQINNVLAFPGLFRGAFDARASDINQAMLQAAAQALADLIGDQDLSAERILPDPLDPRLREAVSRAVYQAALDSGVARL